MYIIPNSNLNILRGVPLDTSYEHTIYFANALNQYTYFNTLAKYRKAQYSYLQPNSNMIRVQELSDNLYDCNYIMFQNQAFGNKWFYAFIKSIRYVNNNTSEIEFELDVIQTWLFDFQFQYTFVERTHTVTDKIGEHIEPEPIRLGEYVYNGYEDLGVISNTELHEGAVIICIVDIENGVNGEMYNGIYSGASLWAAYAYDYSAINEFLNQYNQKPDSVVSIYYCPVSFLPDNFLTGGNVIQLSQTTSSESTEVHIQKPSLTTLIDGYYPRNCKLYTYPYYFLHLDNSNGNELTLRYEFFNSTLCTLKVSWTYVMPVEALLLPVNYKNSGGTLNTEKLCLNNYPLCNWNVDTYQAWVAQNQIPLAVNTGASLVGALGQVIGGNPTGGVYNAMQTTANLFNEVYQASIASDVLKGSLQTANINVTSHYQNFYYAPTSINKYQAQCIDDFFDMYGYAVKRIMKPIYNARPHWTYIKTVGAVLTGNLPADDLKRIINIFDSGITFWINGSEIGNYKLDNRANVRG